ncbi:MAG: flavodoxin domain-containing protein [Limnochordales bacterium]|nr:flavodoxin domain-containing protein [Limnochordales bacterium]
MKTLIVYASKHGATRQYAELLAGQLPGETRLVDLKKDPGVDVSPFDTVVVGGAVYFGQVQKEVREFCARNLATLRQKRLGLFICCLFGGQEAAKQLQAAFPAELLATALVKDAFGGRLDESQLSFSERLITRMIVRSAGIGQDGSAPTFTETVARFAERLQTNSGSKGSTAK